MKKRILVIIPAYNEQSNIVNVLKSVDAASHEYSCLVVNDGSKDDTQAVAESAGIGCVIRLPHNLGIGGAVQTGFKYADYHGYDVAIQFDGDGQHLASEIPKIVAPLESGQLDACIGSRFVESNDGFQSTFMRRLGIKTLMVAAKVLSGATIFDSTSGFRAYNKEAIRFLAAEYPTDYPEPESIILLGKNGFKVGEVPVLMVERQGGESSISGWRSMYYMIKVLLAMFMTSRRDPIRNLRG